MKRAKGNLQLGDKVKVLSTGYLAARQYIGRIGNLDYIERASDGKALAYHVEFADDLIIASDVSPEQEV